MEQQVFIREMAAHFNLREPKSNKPTPIYMVIRIGKKQVKFPIGCKIYPTQWNKKKERAYISPMLSELDNQNNFIVNTKISDFLFGFREILNYVCTNPEKLSELEDIVRNKLKGDVTRMKKKENAIKWLYHDLEKAVMKERSKTEYEQQIKDFERFCKSTNRIPLQWKDITYNLIMEYQEWLMSTTARLNSKRDDRTIGGKISKLITRLKKAEKAGQIDLYKSRIHLYEKPKVSYQSQDNTFALSETEIGSLYNLKLTGNLEIARDLFVFQLWAGQRYSDIKHLNNGIIDKENKKIKVMQEKETEPVTIPIAPIALEILGKYNWKLPNMCLNTLNKLLKKAAVMAKLTREHHYTRQYSGNVTSTKHMICDDIASHCARRTFITLMLKKRLLTNEQIMAITGHRTDSAFRRYIKLLNDEVADEALRIFYGEDNDQQQSQQISSISTTSAIAQPFSTDYGYIEQKLREKIEFENKVKEQAEQLQRKEQEISTMRQFVKQQRNYQELFDDADIEDKINQLVMEADQEAIFQHYEQP